jgi:hypothetical protein
MAVVLGLACFGCGNDCDDAVDKLEECGLPTEDADTDDCSGEKECFAKCINDMSCDDIKAGKYATCAAEC